MWEKDLARKNLSGVRIERFKKLLNRRLSHVTFAWAVISTAFNPSRVIQCLKNQVLFKKIGISTLSPKCSWFFGILTLSYFRTFATFQSIKNDVQEFTLISLVVRVPPNVLETSKYFRSMLKNPKIQSYGKKIQHFNWTTFKSMSRHELSTAYVKVQNRIWTTKF